MIKAVERKTVPYVLEDDRSNSPKEQTVFWIMPKRSHEANETLKRYGGTSRDARGGFRDFSVKKLDAADNEEFVSIVEKVERFGLATDSPYYGQFDDGIIIETSDKALMAEIARGMSSAHLTEIFDAAGDAGKLESGRYLGTVNVNLQEKLEGKK
jgi:hypothetical protein